MSRYVFDMKINGKWVEIYVDKVRISSDLDKVVCYLAPETQGRITTAISGDRETTNNTYKEDKGDEE